VTVREGLVYKQGQGEMAKMMVRRWRRNESCQWEKTYEMAEVK
jgi:hypothetical protein